MGKITQAHRMLIEAIINDYHTTRLDSDYVPHVLSKPRTRDAFARFERDILSHTPQSVEPVAWMYTANKSEEGFVQFNKANMNPKYWTETPLYTRPPATDVAALVEAARAFASKQTVAEALADPTPTAWAGLPVQERLNALAAHKAQHDAEILALRQALAPFTKGQDDA